MLLFRDHSRSIAIMAVDESVSKTVVDVVSEPAVQEKDTPSDESSDSDSDDGKSPPPLLAKLCAVILISCISFGSHWSSGVTGAMKSTIKKVRKRLLIQHGRPTDDLSRSKCTSTMFNSHFWKQARISWPHFCFWPVV